MMKEFITSDTHFGHINICGENGFVSGRRRFKTTEEMDSEIIRNFNKIVSKSDITYHLGDICLNMKPWEVNDILTLMNGAFVFIRGNHDNSKLFKGLQARNFELPDGRMKYEFHDVGIRKKFNKKAYYLTHFPLGLGENRAIYRNLCGHIHDEIARESNVLNVGVDSLELPEGLPFGQPIELIKAYEMVDSKWNNWKEQQDRLKNL